MPPMLRSRLAKLLLTSLCFFGVAWQASSQSNKVMGEVRLEGASKVERDSGVWVDGEFVGFLKELKGNKKVLLLPGENQLELRQARYDSFARTVQFRPVQGKTLRVG